MYLTKRERERKKSERGGEGPRAGERGPREAKGVQNAGHAIIGSLSRRENDNRYQGTLRKDNGAGN